MAGFAPLPRGLRCGSAFAYLALIIGFPLLTLWFKLAAPYDTYFFTSNRAELLLHVAARIAFTAYLFVVFFGSGQWLLRGMTRHLHFLSLTACEEIAVSVLAGSALIRICMVILGFAKLYSFGLLMPLGALALAGAGRLPQLLRLSLVPENAFLTVRIVRIALLTILFAAIATVLASRLLYPNGNGDYFTHYFHYYLQVIKHSGIWPNDVWYHFYVSKGAGDVFFAMILSDPLAPLTVSFVMYLSGIVIGYAFLKRMTQNVMGSLLVSVMLASAFIWTVQTHKPFNCEWAEFSKQHVITAVLFFGTVWATWLLEELPIGERGAWRNITGAIVVGLVVLRPQFAALCDVYFILLAVIAALRRSPLIRTYIFLAFVAAMAAIVMLTVNYAITGLADVTPFRLFWRFADQERFSHWFSPFLMLTLELGSSSDLGALTTPEFGHYRLRMLLALIFRFDLIMPYIIPLLLSATIMAVAMWRGSWRRSLTLPAALVRGLLCLLAMLLAAVITAFCNNQLLSTYRLYMFCLYPVLMITAIPFAVAQRICSEKPWSEKITLVGIVVIAVLAFAHPLHQGSNKLKWHWINFALGKSNIADAYAEQHLLWKPGITACGQVPPDTPIWYSQVTGEHFESPHCRFETFSSYAMGRDFAVINFDDAAKAEAALRRQNLNYFLINTNEPFFDILPYSVLFSPEEIGNHFGIAWSHGGVYLLTWRSLQTTPLPAEFFTDYRRSLKSALKNADFAALHHALRGYFIDWKRNPHWPIAVDPRAPHPRGWQ